MPRNVPTRPSFQTPTTSSVPSVWVRETDWQPVPMIVKSVFDAVNAVPEQVGVMLFERAGAIDVAADDITHLGVVTHRGDPRAEPERGARETRGVRLPGQVEDRDRVGQGAGDRLVDEHRLVGLEDGPRLLEMRPAVDALQQHDVDLRQQLVDRADDRHAELVAQLLGEAGHAVAAGGDVRAASGISRHDANAGQLGLGLGAFKSCVNATTCEVSRPMMPARSGFDGCSSFALARRCKPDHQNQPGQHEHDAHHDHAA